MVRKRGAAAHAVAVPPTAAPSPDDGYGSLTAAEVLADLPSLEAEQLLIVKALEEAGEGRAVILDRIADLLVVRHATRHLAPAPAGAAPRSASPHGAPPRSAPPRSAAGAPGTQVPPLPDKAVSPELVDQMGSLLAKSAARRTSEAAGPLPPLDGPAVAPAKAKGEAKAKRNGRRQTPNGMIVPTGGRRLNTARAARVLIGLIILALLAGGAALYWKRSHRSDTALIIQPAPSSLADLLVKNVPAGYVQQPDTLAGTGPADLAQAAQQDGATGAQAVLAEDGFVQGYQRLWTTAGRQQGVDVFVYRFRTPTGASTYAPQAVATEKATAPSSFAVAGIPGAVGLAGNHDNQHSAEVLFAQGAYWVKVAASGPSANVVAQQVAAAQYSLIPA